MLRCYRKKETKFIAKLKSGLRRSRNLRTEFVPEDMGNPKIVTQRYFCYQVEIHAEISEIPVPKSTLTITEKANRRCSDIDCFPSNFWEVRGKIGFPQLYTICLTQRN
jgi:hypothetical protein